MSNALLIRNGHLLTMVEGRDELIGDVLIRDGLIADVGENLEDPDAEVIDATGMIVCPGFIDAHSHLWESALRNIGLDWVTRDYMLVVRGRFGNLYEPRDIYEGTLLGAAEMIDSGVTSVLDCSHNMNTPEHADAAYEALAAAGIRAVLAYGSASGDWDPQSEWKGRASAGLSPDVIRFREQYFSGETGLISMALCSRGARSDDGDATWFADVRLARELDVPITFTAGLKNRERTQSEIVALHAEGLTGPDILCYHGDRYDEEELRILADTGGKLVYTPEVEMRAGGSFASMRDLIDLGLKPSLGFDVATCGTNFINQMKATLLREGNIQRSRQPRYGAPAEEVRLTVNDVLRMATVNGAYSSWYGDTVGTLAPGKIADIIVVDKQKLTWLPNHNAAGSLVYNATPANVRDVIIGGRVEKRDGTLVNLRRDQIVTEAYASRQRLFSGAGLDPETGTVPGVA